jgi:two-component system response regulator VanR
MPGKPLIALVDDEMPIIELLNDFLIEEGYATLCCYSGKAGYAAIKKEQPDLVILDLQMEERDTGLQVLGLLRLDPSTAKIPVIMCSASRQFLWQNENQLRAYSCVVLEKPFDLDEMLDKIKEMVGFQQSA